MAPAGSLRRYSQESHGAPSLVGEEGRQAGHRAQGQRELRGRRAVRALNRDLLQLRRRAGGDGSNATRRGDDHVTRTSDAIERESSERRGGEVVEAGAPDASEPGRSPAGRSASSTADRAARAVPTAGPGTRRPPGRSRRRPASGSGCRSPFPLPANNASDARRSRAPWRPLARLRRREFGGDGIGQAMYAAQSFM